MRSGTLCMVSTRAPEPIRVEQELPQIDEVGSAAHERLGAGFA